MDKKYFIRKVSAINKKVKMGMDQGLTGNREIRTINNPEEDDPLFPALDKDEIELWKARGGSSNFGQSFIQGGK